MIQAPHLHVYVETELGGRPLSKLHVPTSHVRLGDVVVFLIEELGVEPREQCMRPDRGEPRWRRILRESSETILRLENAR